MSKSLFLKLFICIVSTIIILSLFCLPLSHASSIGEVFSEGKSFLSKGNSISTTLNTTQLENTSNYIYNALLGLAIMVAIIVAMVLGIQFMAASADEKAKIKEAILPFVVGCIVVFGAFTIWKIAVNIGNDAENSTGSSGAATYTRINGKLYCECGDEISIYEQHAGHCANCDKDIQGI